ncbi:2-oxo-4-hydroxy-4-carboxy-5-ureidoimidazoline decarboxylase [Niallia circulans]|uniref:2-oxo-4-hydroxy-4-carboxy-5-ureidoimidazoline decarboxylase n=1 Tax=Niallia circulans TaxID=1397 RepID=A0A553SMQ7_NIACI|nr:2-oxo-4-hydroxy-4-carboxy-5-ureidoimidazoline decarboxylase [Niallia circulans]TRZ38284.1 2-oxo-4-hydroxy-4-carboxy-5-ureidoimidazoline decarboxylase [Niallia circulans]
MYTLADINKMDKEQFIESIGWVFEHTPWIASKAWELLLPIHSLNRLHEVMVQVVKEASQDEQLKLIRAHPDLGGRIKMTDSSVKEQQGAGLDQLSEEEFERFLQLNNKYREKFDFPFILAVKGHTKDTIYHDMERRLKHSKEEEFAAALSQIFKISFIRLEGIVKDPLEA